MAIALNAAGEPIGEDLPEHLSFDVAIGNPLQNNSEEELERMAVRWGQEAGRTFDASISKLQSLVRTCSPITLLSHFAYFDTAFY
jgi:hypothetical protein